MLGGGKVGVKVGNRKCFPFSCNILVILGVHQYMRARAYVCACVRACMRVCA